MPERLAGLEVNRLEVPGIDPAGRHELVAPVPLRLVQRHVGAADELFRRLAAVPARDSCRHRLAAWHHLAEALDESLRVRDRAPGQRDGELLAAVAGDRVAGA